MFSTAFNSTSELNGVRGSRLLFPTTCIHRNQAKAGASIPVIGVPPGAGTLLEFHYSKLCTMTFRVICYRVPLSSVEIEPHKACLSVSLDSLVLHRQICSYADW